MSSRLTLNVFTPLPPQETEIANFSKGVLAELGLIADVRVWVDQDTYDPSLKDVVEVRQLNLRTPWRELNEADVTFYNIGNNSRYHRTIMDVARKMPGVVILHDTRLQHFFANYAETPGPDRDFYLDALRKVHGDDAAEDALKYFNGKLKFDHLVANYPMVQVALEGALAAVIHNRVEFQRLSALTSKPLYYLPLSFKYGAISESLGTERKVKRLIVFGFLGRNRRLAEILEALAGMKDKNAYRLEIYGRIIMEEDIDALIEDLGLGGIVKNYGYVDEDVLQKALDEADLAINMRDPTMGEASSSQLRIWSASIPSLVTRIGWYATLPEDAVFFVEPEREIESVRLHLRALCIDPARFKTAGARGRFYLEKDHHPEQYAQSLVAIANDVVVQHAHLGAQRLASRAASVMQSMFGAETAAAFTSTVAAGIFDVMMPRREAHVGDDL